MEKISGIVRGNSRVTNADNKNAAPARTGMPSFGRPVGESTPTQVKSTSTASRAVALHNGMVEAKKAFSQERVISQMADEFFMKHSRPEAPIQNALPVPEIAIEAASTDDLVMGDEVQSIEVPQQEYTPRGSYIDVRA